MTPLSFIIQFALIFILISTIEGSVDDKNHRENSVVDQDYDPERDQYIEETTEQPLPRKSHQNKTNGSQITQAQILALIKAIESNQILKSLPPGIFEKEKKQQYRNIWERFFKPQRQKPRGKGKDKGKGQGSEKQPDESEESREEIKVITEKPKHYIVDEKGGPPVEVEDNEGQKRRSALASDESAFEKWYQNKEWMLPGSVMDVTTTKRPSPKVNDPPAQAILPDEDDGSLGYVPDENSCDKYALTSDQIKQLKPKYPEFGTDPRHREQPDEMGKSAEVALSEILPKFKQYKKRLQTLLARLAPQCPEINPHELLTDWMNLFHKTFPNFDKLNEKSKKYVDELRAKLEKCYERLVKSNFGIGKRGIDPKIVADLEEDLDTIKVKRSFDSHDGILARSFRSELIEPILNFYRPDIDKNFPRTFHK